MKTDNKADQLYGVMLAKVESLFPHVSSRVIVTQLQLIVERFTFAGLNRLTVDGSQKFELCRDLIQDEVPAGMLDFVQVVVKNGYLWALEGENGREFITYCIRHYRSSHEVIFTSALPLDTDFQETIAESLKPVHGENAKVVFQVSPGLVAGFVIKDGANKKHDYSLATAMRGSLQTYVRNMYIDGIKGTARG